MVEKMIASDFLCSVYLACFMWIDPVAIGEGVKVGGEFDWLQMSLEVKGRDNYSGIYDGHHQWRKI